MGAHGGWDGFPGGTLPRGEPCRRRRQGGKEKAGKGRKVYMFYMLIFSSFFCASLQTQKEIILLCMSLCIHKKEKKCICKIVYRKQSWRYACICLCMYFKKVQRLV